MVSYGILLNTEEYHNVDESKLFQWVGRCKSLIFNSRDVPKTINIMKSPALYSLWHCHVMLARLFSDVVRGNTISNQAGQNHIHFTFSHHQAFVWFLLSPDVDLTPSLCLFTACNHTQFKEQQTKCPTPKLWERAGHLNVGYGNSKASSAVEVAKHCVDVCVFLISLKRSILTTAAALGA